VRGSWYFPVTLLSGGLLAWVPFAHGAARLRSRARAVQAGGYAAVSVLAVVMVTIAPVDAAGDTVGIGSVEMAIGVLSLFGLVFGGCMQQVRLRREAYDVHPSQHTRRSDTAVDPAIARVLDARARRVLARKIAAKDPLMAHELRIGRPDLRRTYDDGGLVDLNAASAQAIARACELAPGLARAIVDARSAGGFLSVDDVFVLIDIPPRVWPVVRDKAVVITL
jgi:DNA uptake protein ComE-like DNA-binding protein